MAWTSHCSPQRPPPHHCHFPSLFSHLLSRLHLGFDLHRRDGTPLAPVTPSPASSSVPGPPAPTCCPSLDRESPGTCHPTPCSTAAPRTLPSWHLCHQLGPTHRVVTHWMGPTSPQTIVTASCPHLQSDPHAGARPRGQTPPVTPLLRAVPVVPGPRPSSCEAPST